MTTVQAHSFTYRGRDAQGKVVKGKLDAASSSAVVSRLRTMGVSPISIEEAPKGTGLNTEINLSFFSKRVKTKDLAIASRQMATMVSSGLSLLRALAILAEQTESKPLAAAFEAVRLDVESGSSFSEGIAKHPDVFPPLMYNLVKAGETGGFLDGALLSIAENFEAEVKLTGKIKSAMTYPVVVLILAVVAVAAMMIFIVPVFEAMFTQLGATLPAPTQFLVVLSHNMVFIVPIVVVGSIVGTWWWRHHKNDENVRAFIDPLKLKAPIFGNLLKKVAIARLTRNLSTMMGAGVPLLKSLAIVGSTSGNWVVEQALVRVSEAVRQGSTIAAPLAKEPIFPPMVAQMMAVGEDSGSLQTMLAKVSDFYDDEVESTTDQLTALIEPLMIAVIGLLVGGMIVALYMPIFEIYNSIN